MRSKKLFNQKNALFYFEIMAIHTTVQFMKIARKVLLIWYHIENTSYIFLNLLSLIRPTRETFYGLMKSYNSRHPPFSSDLTPTYFLFFPQLKRALEIERFANPGIQSDEGFLCVTKRGFFPQEVYSHC